MRGGGRERVSYRFIEIDRDRDIERGGDRRGVRTDRMKERKKREEEKV